MDAIQSTAEAVPTSTSSIDEVESTAGTLDVTGTSDCYTITYIWQEMGEYTEVDSTKTAQ
jgi:hypothetical protein